MNSTVSDIYFSNLNFIIIKIFEPILCLGGIIGNFINILVFSNSTLKENIFSHLLALSASNFLYVLLILSRWIFRFFATESQSYIFSSYAAAFYYNYIYNIGMLFLCTSNSLLEIFILIDRLFLMKTIVRFKISCQTALLLTLIISSLASLGFIPLAEIIELNKNAYAINGTSFSKTIEGQVLYQILLIYKNVVLIMISFILYAIILVDCTKFYNKKKVLVKADKCSQKSKFIKMTIIMFGLFFIGNSSNAMVGIYSKFYRTHAFTDYMRVMNHIGIHLTTTFNIFIFYATNTKYKKIFLDLWSK